MDWDVARYPDYKEFLSVAQQLGVKLVVFHHREFESAVIIAALEELQDNSYEFEISVTSNAASANSACTMGSPAHWRSLSIIRQRHMRSNFGRIGTRN